MIFFFKRKSAYDMRISEWSSDVCSSDLRRGVGDEGRRDVAVFGTEFAAHDDLRALGARVFDQRLDAFEVPRIDDAWIFRILVEAFAARVVHRDDFLDQDRKSTRLNSSH